MTPNSNGGVTDSSHRSISVGEAVHVANDSRLEADREAVQVAHEMGYFKVPRQTTLVDVAAELDRSDDVVSKQIRRGVDDILRNSSVSHR